MQKEVKKKKKKLDLNNTNFLLLRCAFYFHINRILICSQRANRFRDILCMYMHAFLKDSHIAILSIFIQIPTQNKADISSRFVLESHSQSSPSVTFAFFSYGKNFQQCQLHVKHVMLCPSLEFHKQYKKVYFTDITSYCLNRMQNFLLVLRTMIRAMEINTVVLLNTCQDLALVLNIGKTKQNKT